MDKLFWLVWCWLAFSCLVLHCLQLDLAAMRHGSWVMSHESRVMSRELMVMICAGDSVVRAFWRCLALIDLRFMSSRSAVRPASLHTCVNSTPIKTHSQHHTHEFRAHRASSKATRLFRRRNNESNINQSLARHTQHMCLLHHS